MCPCPLRSDDDATTSNASSNTTIVGKDRGTPSSIPSKSGFWSYPSNDRFHASVSTKGHTVDPKDIPATVSIHNSVNEVAWKKIMDWEKLSTDSCKDSHYLEKFYGDSKYGSLKSKIYGSIKGWTDPFDTHIWVVNRCGKPVKYLIDFYSGSVKLDRGQSQHQAMPVSIFVDVRPKVEDFDSFIEYSKMTLSSIYSKLAS